MPSTAASATTGEGCACLQLASERRAAPRPRRPGAENSCDTLPRAHEPYAPYKTCSECSTLCYTLTHRLAAARRYDWSQLTTAAWNDDPALMCAAHAANARVVLDGRGANAPAVYANRTARAEWVADQLTRALHGHLDGINFDLVGAACHVPCTRMQRRELWEVCNPRHKCLVAL